MSRPISDDATKSILLQALALISVKGYRNPNDGLFYKNIIFTELLNANKRAIHYDLIENKKYVWN